MDVEEIQEEKPKRTRKRKVRKLVNNRKGLMDIQGFTLAPGVETPIPEKIAKDEKIMARVQRAIETNQLTEV